MMVKIILFQLFVVKYAAQAERYYGKTVFFHVLL